MAKQYYVYIMCSNSGTLYIGLTNNIERRVYEHKQKVVQGFTAQYNVNRLVHVETFEKVSDAIQREKELKKWRRSKKIALIEEANPKWEDLSE
ncbi:MAG: GIY-YIG nuclease family protein [Anaerolineales bacterium]|nr:GIY-YIG nuclease family protein [Anaerolineales bacterium]